MFDQFAYLRFYLVGLYPAGDLGGLSLNILLAFTALSISFLFGVILGICRISHKRVLQYPSICYVEIVRATPLIMIIFWFYFFFPNVLGKPISVFWSCVISLSVYAAAYQAEIVRAGILAVSRGQIEVALSSGMTQSQAIRLIVLPQAFKMMIPAFLSFFISLFKDTSITYVIGMVELMQAGVIVSQRQPDKMLESYLVVAVGYFIVCYGMSYLAGKLEKKFGIIDYETIKL